MGRQSTFDLHDRLLNGRLTTLLTAWRSETPPVSFEEIAARLREHDVFITGETARRWYSERVAGDLPESA